MACKKPKFANIGIEVAVLMYSPDKGHFLSWSFNSSNKTKEGKTTMKSKARKAGKDNA